MPEKSATLTIGGKQIDLPIYEPTEGPAVIDVASLISAGYFTFDPGYMSTASCNSELTYIDGDNGILLHCGYAIEDLAAHSDFLELCYLLLNRRLPNAEEKAAFDNRILSNRDVDGRLTTLCKSFGGTDHPMGVMCALVAALSAHKHHETDISNAVDREEVYSSLVAKIPTLAAMTYRQLQGLPLVQPNDSLGYAENFLHMMFGKSETPEVSPVLARAMDRIFLLHADHEQNASTSTVRMAGSTGANPYACAAAGIAALWGPAHGGANEAVLNMIRDIGDPKEIPKYIAKAKDRDDPFRIMGFGHRVYKNYDPRARVMQETCDEVLSELGIHDDSTLEMARMLEEAALHDEFFIERKLYPNVDFYSGVILKAMGVPTEMFTVIFTTGRMPGWMAQWNEMVSTDYKIGRPRQMYVGEKKRPFPPLADR